MKNEKLSVIKCIFEIVIGKIGIYIILASSCMCQNGKSKVIPTLSLKLQHNVCCKGIFSLFNILSELDSAMGVA